MPAFAHSSHFPNRAAVIFDLADQVQWSKISDGLYSVKVQGETDEQPTPASDSGGPSAAAELLARKICGGSEAGPLVCRATAAVVLASNLEGYRCDTTGQPVVVDPAQDRLAVEATCSLAEQRGDNCDLPLDRIYGVIGYALRPRRH